MMMELPQPKLIQLEDNPPKGIITDFRRTRIDEYFRSRELSANSQRAYRRAFARFSNWTDRAWHDIKHQDLDRYKEYLKSLELSAATICQELAALKSFFNWLTIKDYISKDPTLTLTKPKLKPPSPQELSEEEVESLFNAVALRGFHQVRDRALLRVLVSVWLKLESDLC